MRILVTGANGRLGSSIAQLLNIENHTVVGVDIDTMDITDSESVQETFSVSQPNLVIHCAALTAVDYCAQHPDEAIETNGFGTQTIALACQQHDAAMVYVSTNEVFDGTSNRAYREYDTPNPVNPYGYSKYMGEQIVRDLVSRHFIVRTAWLFAHGGRNFIHVMLDLAQKGKPLRVVTNEIGSPTYTNDLAAAVCRLIQTDQYGIYHLVNAGQASRYEFARHVLDLAGYTIIPIEPITLEEYPRPSRPPEYASLRNMAGARLGITLRPWKEAVAAFLDVDPVARPGAEK
ncbi:MAG: dTDP-4-dehydrorhamnose reductase [Anaerolineae bacterium]|nr:dTDP-4-dehydrorhamnose reductase [Anaerolineae bacterium]